MLNIRKPECLPAGLLLFEELEPYLRTGADSHQAEQRGAELRHGQTVIHGSDNNNPPEYRFIGDPKRAGQYRRSFRYYTEASLLLSSLLHAFISAVLLGVFLVRYKPEFLFAIPLFCVLFVWYLHIAIEAN
ncbi:MAG: hypothetical protein L0Y39_10350 [Methylococcaceae bacterium]|nr:hypothetical protein [Methylococcaceae bacterium]